MAELISEAFSFNHKPLLFTAANMQITKRFFKVFTGWWLVWAALQLAMLYWAGFSLRVSLTDSFVTNLFTASCCLLVNYVMRFYLPQKEKYWFILALSIFLSLLQVFLSKWFISLLFAGEATYLSFYTKTLPVRFGISFLLIACLSLISLLWYTFLEQQEREQRQSDMEKLSKEAELFKLRQQLQPHFLFNSLNSISALVGSRPEEARSMIQQLSDFLRGTIKKGEQQLVKLSEELEHLQLYLDIEKVRFGHRLATSIEIDEDASSLKLPSLLLQPVVENAIKFGLYDTTETVTILIKANKENNNLVVIIQNPFDAQTSLPQKGEGFGLSSVRRRLYLLFARTDLVTTDAKENVFTTAIKIPQLI